METTGFPPPDSAETSGQTSSSGMAAAIIFKKRTELKELEVLRGGSKSEARSAKDCEGISSIKYALWAGGGKQWEHCSLLAVQKGAWIEQKLHKRNLLPGSGALLWWNPGQHRSQAVASRRCEPPRRSPRKRERLCKHTELFTTRNVLCQSCVVE